MRALVLDCLRYWATEMRVDGFRFDLAPIVGRDSSGYSASAPFFAALRADPVLAYVKLIAEPWDVGPAATSSGHFPAGWSEWNDRYRDTMRAFWRGDRALLGAFAERFAGSSDLFRAARAQADGQRQLRRRARRLHAARTPCPTTSVTTRPTSRTAPTATPTT